MRRLLGIICLAVWLPLSGWTAKIELCEQSVLTWEVNLGSMRHEFVLRNLKVQEDGGIGFSYTMEGYRAVQGDVVISPKAMAKARKQYNYFAGGEVYLKEKTSVFVSRLVANELKKGGAKMQPEEKEFFFKKSGKEKLEVQVNGETKKLKGTLGVAKNGNRVVIWKNKTLPMVLHMELGWEITLKSIETEC